MEYKLYTNKQKMAIIDTDKYVSKPSNNTSNDTSDNTRCCKVIYFLLTLFDILAIGSCIWGIFSKKETHSFIKMNMFNLTELQDFDSYNYESNQIFIIDIIYCINIVFIMILFLKKNNFGCVILLCESLTAYLYFNIIHIQPTEKYLNIYNQTLDNYLVKNYLVINLFSLTVSSIYGFIILFILFCL